ncbi:MAG: terminase small subunit [Rhodospirillales bacterium]|nr:terminase small subunit [Rhodospirillales bacterium]
MEYDPRTPAGIPPRRPQPSPGNSGPTGAPADRPLRSRHEAFCQHFATFNNATVAAREAGYAPQSAHNQGYRLMRHPRIQARIADIRRVLARAQCLDEEVLLGKLEIVYQRAVGDHHFHAAARAVDLQDRIAQRLAARKAPSALPRQEARSGETATGIKQEARSGETATGIKQEARSGETATGIKQEARSGEAATGTKQEARSGETATGTKQEARSGALGPRQVYINDDILGPVSEQKSVNSTPCAKTVAQK